DLTIVGHMDIGHEHVVVADLCNAAAAPGAAVDGDELAKDVALADNQAALFATKLEVLRNEANRSERIDFRALANVGPPIDHCGGTHPAIRTERDSRPDYRMRTNLRPVANFRRRVDDGCGVDFGSVRHQAEEQLALRDDLITDEGRRLRFGERG